jgi:hypothetical protein
VRARRRTAPALLLAALLLATGCGADPSPADAAPELATRLDSVDAAIAAGNYNRARTTLEALAASAVRAERAGDLDESQADRITNAVNALLAELPDEASRKEPTGESDVEPTPSEATPSEAIPSERTETTPSAPETSTPETSEDSEPKPSQKEPKNDKTEGKKDDKKKTKDTDDKKDKDD